MIKFATQTIDLDNSLMAFSLRNASNHAVVRATTVGTKITQLARSSRYCPA
jgi:hypothetical protein